VKALAFAAKIVAFLGTFGSSAYLDGEACCVLHAVQCIYSHPGILEADFALGTTAFQL
jgi:hypothetical protein